MNIPDTYTNLLRPFLSFKSISTDIEFKSDIEGCASWLVSLFKDNGFDAKTIEGYGNPIVIASIEVDPNFETCLIYGHYDVQPASLDEGWMNDPFELTEVEGRIFARGVVDNKGQVMIHIATVFDLLKEKKLKYNIKFLIEGDEESASPHLEEFFEDNAEDLRCDFVLISDGELTMNHPSIDVAFRGVINATLVISTSQKDNHSGLYGGSIPNSAGVLSKLLSKMHDEDGNLNISGIDNSLDIPKEIIQNNKSIPFYLDEFKKNTGVRTRLNESITDFYTQVGLLTSAEITTLNSGYLGDGYRNAIPGRAEAKINFRVSPLHTNQQIKRAFVQFIKDNVPEYSEYTLIFDQENEAINLDRDNEYMKNAKELLEKIYGKQTFYKYCGAIVPIAGYFAKFLNVPVLDVGLGNEDCNMHGVNENFEIETLRKGLMFSRAFLEN